MKNRKEIDDSIIITDDDYDDYIRLYNLKKGYRYHDDEKLDKKVALIVKSVTCGTGVFAFVSSFALLLSNNFTIPSALFISLVPTTGTVSVVLSSSDRLIQNIIISDFKKKHPNIDVDIDIQELDDMLNKYESKVFERKYQDNVVNDSYIDSEEQETNAERIKALNEQKEFLRSIDDKKQQDTVIDESDIIKVKMKDNKNN